MSTEQITIRLPIERVAELRDNAKAQHRSLAREVEHRLSIADAASRAPAPPNTHAQITEPDG